MSNRKYCITHPLMDPRCDNCPEHQQQDGVGCCRVVEDVQAGNTVVCCPACGTFRRRHHSHDVPCCVCGAIWDRETNTSVSEGWLLCSPTTPTIDDSVLIHIVGKAAVTKICNRLGCQITFLCVTDDGDSELCDECRSEVFWMGGGPIIVPIEEAATTSKQRQFK